MKDWLMKSEPSEYSIDKFKTDKRGVWDGVRNYQVRNMMRDDMKRGDLALFYHSNAGSETGVVGIMEIIMEAYPDHTQFDPQSLHFDQKSDPSKPRWLCVDVKYVRKLARTVTLKEIKQETILANLPLVKKGNRLSIINLTKSEYNHIVKLSEK